MCAGVPKCGGRVEESQALPPLNLLFFWEVALNTQLLRILKIVILTDHIGYF